MKIVVFALLCLALATAPAELFNLSQHEGKVAPGMRGDLTILSQDPATGDPGAFTSVKYTIRGGKVIWRRERRVGE